MKFRNLLVYNLILLMTVVITAQVVIYQFTGNYTFNKTSDSNFQLSNKKCTDDQSVPRPSTTDPQLKIVTEYEAACQSEFVDNIMIFTNMPVSKENAQLMADAMTVRLREFKKFSISPIVIIEPDSEWGLVDFHEYAMGFYDAWIVDYFERLAANGISEEDLGIWIPFPEPQQEFWNNNADPDDFAISVNKYLNSLRKQYPKAQTAILLDSQTGEAGKIPQLLAYTRLIEEGLVDYAGLQGFPWHPREEGDERNSVTSAEVFAPAYLAEEVAKSLKTKKIFINTGTYRHKKAANGGFITITTQERSLTLESIYDEVLKLRNKEYEVLLNVFSENKLDNKEGVDWSYWQAGLYEQSDHTALFTNFIYDLKNNGANISIFDSR